MATFAQESGLTGIRLRDAYAAIRAWYVANLWMIEWRPGIYYTSASTFIQALPEELSDLEIRLVCAEVLGGLLEWAYCESDGQFRMAEYACAALRPYGVTFTLTPDEREELRASVLWPLFTFNRPW